MKVPRSSADLPFADSLVPLRESLEPDGDYDRAMISDISLTDARADNARFTETVFTGVTFDSGNLKRSRLSDVWFGESRFIATELAESTFIDTWLSGCVLAGLQAFSVNMRRAVFRNCKLDSVNFRDSTLTDVAFEDCVLRDTDFSGAKLTRVKFPGATLTGADFTKVTCSAVDLRGAALGIRAGFDSLHGARINSLQLVALAPYLAQQLGLVVED